MNYLSQIAMPSPMWGFPTWLAALSIAVVVVGVAIVRDMSRGSGGEYATSVGMVCIAILIPLIIGGWNIGRAVADREWKADVRQWATDTYGVEISDRALEGLVGQGTDAGSPHSPKCESGLPYRYFDHEIHGAEERVQFVIRAGEPALYLGEKELERS